MHCQFLVKYIIKRADEVHYVCIPSSVNICYFSKAAGFRKSSFIAVQI